jgi:pimeloyl-ACP methyl ester carboxylesterase
LIHGWTGDSGTWSALIPLIVADNRFDAFEVATVDYASTNLLDRTVTLHQMAAKIRLAIGSRLAGRKTVIVTHSTGGVLARQIILDEWARPEPSLTIERLVSLAPPHGGSDVAQTAGFLGVIQIMLRELQERSTYLAELNTSWRVAASTFAETCIFAGRDGIVTSMSATRGCVHSLKLDGWGHAEVHRPAFNGDGRYIAISAALTEPLR